MDCEIREQLRDLVLTEEEKRKLGGSNWPVEYVVPPEHSDSDPDKGSTLYKDPVHQYSAKFYMPPPEHDFPCHECGGNYGPWVHKGLQINCDRGHGTLPVYVNILHERNRWCEDCGYKFHNSYAVGKVFFERNERGLLSFDRFC